MMVFCDKCNKELQSSEEKISHICSWDSGSSVKSGPPSISLLADRSPSPSPEVFKDAAMEINSEASWADPRNTNKSLEGHNVEEFSDKGEILEGHSEVAGPSGIQVAGPSGIQGAGPSGIQVAGPSGIQVA